MSKQDQEVVKRFMDAWQTFEEACNARRDADERVKAARVDFEKAMDHLLASVGLAQKWEFHEYGTGKPLK